MDDGLLIEQVAGFPALFNKNDCRFKNKTAREQAWQTIAEIMGCSVEDCSNRWVVLRAKYTTLKKQIRETPSGSAGFSISWPHYEAMGFLDPFLVTRRTISNIKLKYQNISNLESSEQGQGPSSIWDTMSQLEFSDVSVGAPETEDSVTEVTDETDFSPPPTPDPISKSGTPTTSHSQLSTTSTSFSSFNQKMAALRRQNTKGRGGAMGGTKRNAQEAMCHSITSAIGDFQKRHQAYSEGIENMAPSSWAKILAEDMLVLSPSQRIIFKKKCYDILAEMVQNTQE
ncbi:unnamed protein product [Ceutorhynchus assimilis]|uniref:MADF domain-containing protein n=1 Tax=Ceutorhynchus assimilis TaxID=467358 RepID=A0A9P0DV13_9CUCU|nr:unnamed protein product [Ceutorhynchus assimilis]